MAVSGRWGLHISLLFPIPTTVFDTAVSLAESGALWENTWITVLRVAAGMLIGGGLGLLFGAAVGTMRIAEDVVNPTAQMVRMVPHLALTSLFVLWFGIGETSKVLLIAKGVFFPIYISGYQEFRTVDTRLVEVGRVLNFSKLDLFRRLLVPHSAPQMFTGLRLSMGIAWGAVVVSEMISSSAGLGYMMIDGRSFSDTPWSSWGFWHSQYSASSAIYSSGPSGGGLCVGAMEAKDGDARFATAG